MIHVQESAGAAGSPAPWLGMLPPFSGRARWPLCSWLAAISLCATRRHAPAMPWRVSFWCCCWQLLVSMLSRPRCCSARRPRPT